MNVLDELERLIGNMTPEEKAEFDRSIEQELKLAWLPTPGPQTEAYLSAADILLYGGAAGGGKTDLLLGTSLNTAHRGIIYRRAFTDLKGITDRLLEMAPSPKGFTSSPTPRYKTTELILDFGALEKPRSEFTAQGVPRDFIGFDEGAQLSAKKVAFVIGWNRTTKPGQRTRVIIASNPPIGGEGEWLIIWFGPWLDPNHPNPARPGELRWAVTSSDQENPVPLWVDGPDPLFRIEGDTFRKADEWDFKLAEDSEEMRNRIIRPKSYTFIPARLGDNPYLGDDYRATIQAMPEPMRTQLLEGDFLAGRKDHAYQVIPSAWVYAAQDRWRAGRPKGVKMTTIGADIAQGGADNFVLAPLYLIWFDKLIREKGINVEDGTKAGSLIVQHMRDAADPVVDMGGGWGSGASTFLKQNDIAHQLFVPGGGSDKRDNSKTLGFLNRRAEAWWMFREALDPSLNNPEEMPALPPDARLFAQLTTPRWTLRGTAIKVEEKAEIKKRLDGQSTDDADAVIQAWWGRKAALAKKLRQTRAKEAARKGRNTAHDDYDPLAAMRRR